MKKVKRVRYLVVSRVNFKEKETERHEITKQTRKGLNRLSRRPIPDRGEEKVKKIESENGSM